MLKTSALGTQFFAHARRADCTWKPENVEHLRSKAQIALGCRDAGWEPRTEASSPNGSRRADVLSRDGKRAVAFEVPRSGQTFERTLERDRRYLQARICDFWFFRRLPSEVPSCDLPSIRLARTSCAAAIACCTS